MRRLWKFLWLSATLSTSFIVYAYPLDSGFIGENDGGSAPNYAAALTGGEGCSNQKLEDIRKGFVDMNAMFAAALPYNASVQPSVEFFGRTALIVNYTDMISGNLQRAAGYGTRKGKPGLVNIDIHVRCDDPMKLCELGSRRDGKHAAYNIGNDPHVVFCEDYFKLDGLNKKLDRASADPKARNRLMEYYNRGAMWARMVMHFSDIGRAIIQHAVPTNITGAGEWMMVNTQGAMNTSVLAGVLNQHPSDDQPSDQYTLKYAYGPTRAKLLTILSTQMPYDAANNAENYALYALARYAMLKKNVYPNIPIMDFSNEDVMLTNENFQMGEWNKYANFDIKDVLDSSPGLEKTGKPLRGTTSLHSAPSGLMISALVCFVALWSAT